MAFEVPAYMFGMVICSTINAFKSSNDGDIILNLLMAKFVSELTMNQRMEFALIIEMIKCREIYRELPQKIANNEPATSLISTQIPSTDTEFRNIYLRRVHAILSNLPQPEVQ